jgi:hypothetical protein
MVMVLMCLSPPSHCATYDPHLPCRPSRALRAPLAPLADLAVLQLRLRFGPFRPSGLFRFSPAHALPAGGGCGCSLRSLPERCSLPVVSTGGCRWRPRLPICAVLRVRPGVCGLFRARRCRDGMSLHHGRDRVVRIRVLVARHGTTVALAGLALLEDASVQGTSFWLG